MCVIQKSTECVQTKFGMHILIALFVILDAYCTINDNWHALGFQVSKVNRRMLTLKWNWYDIALIAKSICIAYWENLLFFVDS